MKIKPGLLVIVLPKQEIPGRICWGIVKQEVGPTQFWVKTEQTETAKGYDIPDEILIKEADIIPVAEVKNSQKPRLAALKYLPEILIELFLRLCPKEKLADVRVGTLVIILSAGDKILTPEWGVVHRIMPSSDLDVTIGRRVHRKKVFVSPKNVIPVIQTAGLVLSARRTAFRLAPELLMILFCELKNRP
ncbi:hypothetical protein KKG36_02695 [Patescibacteria group bacterium]|nr:hypothetical protein [Patescibacteria group bacterium]